MSGGLEGRQGTIVARCVPVVGSKRVSVSLFVVEAAGETLRTIDILDVGAIAARAKLASTLPAPLQANAGAALLELAERLVTWRNTARTGSAPAAAAGDAPWPEPVAGAELLNDISKFIARYIAVSEEARLAMALWVIHTHAMEAADHTPYLRISSATRECGKTALLEVLAELVARPWFTSGVSGAVLFRKIHLSQPTLLLDEVDTQLANEETAEIVRGVLNAGHKRGGQIDRMVGEGAAMKPGAFNVFCPKVLAGIRQPSDTVVSRSIPIRLKHEPRSVTDQLEKVRARRLAAAAAPLRRRIVRFAADAIEQLRDMEPDVPEELGARQSDIWAPLFAIADAAGESWPGSARRAAIVLHGAEREEGDRGIMLLEDLYDIFGDASGPAHFGSAMIVEDLVKREDRPWGEAGRGGKPISVIGLSALLRRFEVRPENFRRGETVAKGYRRADLEPVWEKYRIQGQNSAYRAATETEPLHPQPIAAPMLALECSGETALQGKGGGWR